MYCVAGPPHASDSRNLGPLDESHKRKDFSPELRKTQLESAKF